jgi:hypothetical protein
VEGVIVIYSSLQHVKSVSLRYKCVNILYVLHE